MRQVRLRRANPGDAAALGAFHVAAWQETYTGPLPDDTLANVSVATRTAMWRKILGDPVTFGEAAVFVAEAGGALAGFGSCCPQRCETLRGRGFSGEISAIYVLQSYQRCGLGRSIMGILAETLFEQGRTAASLWVLRENVMARGFYQRLGGAVVGEKKDERPNETLVEVAYGWPDVSRLLR